MRRNILFESSLQDRVFKKVMGQSSLQDYSPTYRSGEVEWSSGTKRDHGSRGPKFNSQEGVGQVVKRRNDVTNLLFT